MGKSCVAERTALLAADIAAVMGCSLASVEKNLARALEYPIKGEGLLARYGLILNSATKVNIESLIKQGQQLEAQEVVLNILEERFKGARTGNQE